MPLSVTAETAIARPRAEVAAYAMDPAAVNCQHLPPEERHSWRE